MKSKIKDIYNGEYLYVWQDDEAIFFEVLPNGVIISLPAEYWRKFKSELRSLLRIKDEGQGILDEFRPYISSENLFVPSFQSVKDPKKLIKVLDNKRYTEEDAKKCIEYFKQDNHEILIVWDSELEDDNKDILREKIWKFCGEESFNFNKATA